MTNVYQWQIVPCLWTGIGERFFSELGIRRRARIKLVVTGGAEIHVQISVVIIFLVYDKYRTPGTQCKST